MMASDGERSSKLPTVSALGSGSGELRERTGTIRNGSLTNKYGEVPSGNFNIAIQKLPSIVDLPIENGEFP